jgi:hypothetical protein
MGCYLLMRGKITARETVGENYPGGLNESISYKTRSGAATPLFHCRTFELSFLALRSR